MQYFTAKGDTGTTKLFNSPSGVRLSKGEGIFTVLGDLDELNSILGLCRSVARRADFRRAGAAERHKFLQALRAVQERLFIIQAEIAGGGKRLSEGKVAELEETIAEFSGKFPQISSFVVPGATELGAQLDIARVVARRAERAYLRETSCASNPSVSAYLNRLSSLLYVLARFAVFAQGEREEAPRYC